MSLLLLLLCFFYAEGVTSQDNADALEQVLSFEEYLGFVKTHHPLLKQAELTLQSGEANLLKARGGFDPKIEVDYDRKKFDEMSWSFPVASRTSDSLIAPTARWMISTSTSAVPSCSRASETAWTEPSTSPLMMSGSVPV